MLGRCGASSSPRSRIMSSHTIPLLILGWLVSWGRLAILFVLAVVSHLRERPRVYRKVVELLAEPGMSINQITKFCRVSEHTVRAVRDREAIPIAERKERLVSILGPMWPNSQPSAWKNSPPTRLCAMQAWQLASPQTSCSRF